MKLTIESTHFEVNFDGVPVRVWKGQTEAGTVCLVLVHRIATDAPEEFGELREVPSPLVELSGFHVDPSAN